MDGFAIALDTHRFKQFDGIRQQELRNVQLNTHAIGIRGQNSVGIGA